MHGSVTRQVVLSNQGFHSHGFLNVQRSVTGYKELLKLFSEIRAVLKSAMTHLDALPHMESIQNQPKTHPADQAQIHPVKVRSFVSSKFSFQYKIKYIISNK